MSNLPDLPDVADLVGRIVELRSSMLRRGATHTGEAIAFRRLLGDLGRRGHAGQLLHSVFAKGLADESAAPAGSRPPPERAFLQALARNSTEVMLVLDDDNRIRYASPSAADILGAEPAAGTEVSALIHAGDVAAATAMLDAVRTGPPRVASGRRPGATGQWRMSAPGGGWAPFQVSCVDLRGDNAVNALVVTLRDVTRQRRIEQELTFHASHDPLTGSLNRTAFVERVGRAVAGGAVAVVLVGLDDIKMINDALGHDAGDALLVAGARRLATAVPPGVPVARLGGDEFAAVIDGIAGPAEAHRHVERILAAFESPLVVDVYSFSTTASAGLAVSDGSQAVNELLRQAFLALSTARRFGKGSWQQYEPPMQAAALQRLQIHAELDRAVNDRAFTLADQPIVSLDSNDLSGSRPWCAGATPDTG
jgi:diguanylate cyclase (GGDEF)-like protein/PAS domain S-box-containing protein